jgi:EF-P beta-lysylation protein EpmB
MWRAIQRQSFTDWKKLIDYLQWEEPLRSLVLPDPRFPLNLPLRLAEKIQKNTLADPLLRQFLPLKEERQQSPLFLLDPVGDVPSRKAKKLLHKYTGRALLITTSACAMHCRYCFRQNFDYATKGKGFEEELQLLRADPSITEIILSGGDPLSLSNATLQQLITDLSAIPHLKRLRFHTRFPIGIPERIDEAFLKMLEETHLQVVFIIHCNHARELDDDILSALKRIQRLGIPVLNQSVLLKNVNDDVQTLHTLFETLAGHGILPYYLHQLDKVQGAAHFEVDEATGLRLMEELSTLSAGYALPKYVKELAGLPSKQLVTSDLKF